MTKLATDNNLNFTPAQSGRASEDIALQIEAAIIEGRIQPGDRLPSERAMQVYFRTGRGVVREALRILKQKGLLDIRKGSKGGAFIKHVEMATASESFGLFLKRKDIDPESLIEFREALDRAITSLAIVRATESEKKDLVQKALELEAYMMNPVPDIQAVGEMDRALNIQLVRMAKNPVFEWVMHAIQQGFSSYDHALYEDPAYRGMTVANWKDTVREIAAGDLFKALAYISRHYLMLRGCMRDIKGGLPKPAVFPFSPEPHEKPH